MNKPSSLLFLALVAVLLYGAFYALRWMESPIDPPLELQAPTQEPAQQHTNLPVIAKAQGGGARQGGICGDSGTLALQVFGIATDKGWRDDRGLGAVRLVTVDFDQASVAILDVPRALYVDASHLDIPQLTSLAGVYKVAYEALDEQDPLEHNRLATQDTTQVLHDSFGYLPDHYLTVDPAKFVELVDTLGGIDITLDALVDGRPLYGYYPAGENHLDGAHTLDFIRIVRPSDDPNPTVWKKFARQEQVTLALLAAMLTPENWIKLPDVAQAARQAVTTDLSANQVISLLCMVKQAGGEALMKDITPDMVTQVGMEEVRVRDLPAVKDLFLEFSTQNK